MLSDFKKYQDFVYSLPGIYPQIEVSKLVLYRTGPLTGILEGVVKFRNNFTLDILEIIDFEYGIIQRYSYEIYQNEQKLYWYDCQPHPDDPTLSSTHPHHKHIPPDIKHNRKPAEHIHFDAPNLTFLIEEIINNFL